MQNEIFSKPLTKEKAIDNLSKLSGRTHELIGSYVFCKNGKIVFSETVISKMTMKNLDEKDIIDYNAKIGQSRAFEQANFARMQGNLARMQARQAEIGYYKQAGQSLLGMSGGGGGGGSQGVRVGDMP